MSFYLGLLRKEKVNPGVHVNNPRLVCRLRAVVRYCLLLILTGAGSSAWAAGTALDCSYTGSLYIYGPSTTIRVKPNTAVGDPIGEWVNVSSPGDWRCRVLPAFQNNIIRAGVEVFSPYPIISSLNIDGTTYNVFTSAVKPGLGYVVRFRVTGAGFSSNWQPMNGYSAANAVLSQPLLGPIPYNGGAYFTLGFEMQIRFIKSSTALTNTPASAFDPVYIYTYRTYNNGANSERDTGLYRIVQFTGLGVQVMTQTCVTPDVNVMLPEIGANEFTSVGSIRGLQPFNLQFNNCPGGLNGISYKFGATTAVLDAANGVTALSADSTARGVGLLLRSASNTPITMNTEYALSGYTPGAARSYTVPMSAGMYQTSGMVQSGSVKGAYTFTLIYK